MIEGTPEEGEEKLLGDAPNSNSNSFVFLSNRISDLRSALYASQLHSVCEPKVKAGSLPAAAAVHLESAGCEPSIGSWPNESSLLRYRTRVQRQSTTSVSAEA